MSYKDEWLMIEANDDIDEDVVRETRDEAIEHLEEIDEGDHRRAYYESKIRWCNLLLKQVRGSAASAPR